MVALRWLCTPESPPSLCLVYGLAVALGGLSVQGAGFRVQDSMFDVRCWMLFCLLFQMALDSQVVAYRLPTKRLWDGIGMAWGGFAWPLGLAVASGIRGMAESAKLPDSPPLASQGESGPKEGVLEFLGMEQGQLRFPPGFHTGLAGAPSPDEFLH